MLARRLPEPKFEVVEFQGGLDTETPHWFVNPGQIRESQNVEIGINGGYVTNAGRHERFDGQTAPSSAVYAILEVTITGSFSVGDTITQLVSSATAVVLAVVTTETPNYLVITKITGTFDATNDLQVSAATEGTASSLAMLGGASTPLLDAQYKNLAADEYRSDITTVPGAGDILGLILFNDVLYAFRNNAGNTAAAIYKSSTSGWTAVSLGLELSFTGGGTTEIAEGDTITGATSGATADVDRVMLTSGSWAGGDAAGKFILSNQSMTFQAENLNVGASTNLATIAGDSTQITLSPNGRYEFVIENFGGAAGEDRVYGCDGVNRGFEFDGAIFAPIDTGVATDAPTHVDAHRSHLFFSFAGSAQHSGTGTPYIFSPVFGAAELATGDTITGFQVEPGVQGGATLGIYNRNRVHMLYGSDSSDWNLVPYRKEVGAFPYSIQQFGTTLFLDDRGITNLQTTQSYGNFVHATLSKNIQTVINNKKTLICASCISREKSQYRLFFSDNSALFLTTSNQKILGMTLVNLGVPVTSITSQENNAGDEKIYFGSSDGYVYEMDSGTSFDGDAIEWFMLLHFNFSRSIRLLKKYLDIVFDVQGDGYSLFNFSYEIDFATNLKPQPSSQEEQLTFSDVTWDSGTWDVGNWDGFQITPSSFKLSGSGENMSIILRGNSDYHSTVRFNAATLSYLVRRRIRN